ncbi:hypothetical protein ALC62_02064 [Cyphomyrmex costatus]|uniref:Myb/SANT-like DNA-binding domain-containing protein n=1 Tax=Cyphomyrmex costatus TaxID=456900 RepID=A0A151IND6_9HYME|nr:hypothetical protein ALC62_02064 [Cyphomyrmex costatus]
MLLGKAKTLNSKDKPNVYRSTSLVPSTIIDKPRCSKTSTIQHDDVSDIENYDKDETDVPNLESNEIWTHEATLFLISLYKENSYMLGKFPHKKMWTKICQNIKQKKNYNFTVNQCYNKMDTLKRRYRQIVDHNAQSGIFFYKTIFHLLNVSTLCISYFVWINKKLTLLRPELFI